MNKQSMIDYRLLPLPEDLAGQFLSEALVAIAGLTKAEAYQTLWYGYFETLLPFIEPVDFLQPGALTQPQSLRLLVDSSALYRFFRGWLRQHGMEPDEVLPALQS
jgi:hypothetical protein